MAFPTPRAAGKIALTSMALAVAGAFSTAHAAGQDSAARDDVQQVVVTAQKRAQTMVDVPQSMSVVGGDALEKHQATGFADYLKLVPSLQLVQSTPGEGRLVLTEPGDWLTTGIDVEARPAGKKVKRLSLLFGGERSLVAVAFLVSLFIARPSPFYILDEVEAALDDTNLGRLLDIYTELRASSQLLVITHQKRTMEVADALYGVTMRGDGVSAVISQRLREAEAVA